jgi:predicted nucleic acid-binding protein
MTSPSHAIADTSTLSALARIGCLDLLPLRFGSVRVPDAGETAVLALAMETSDTIILMDEKRGRRAARILGLQTTGVLGILSWAKHAGHIPSLAQAISDLRTKDRFFIAPDLLRELLEAAGETME